VRPDSVVGANLEACVAVFEGRLPYFR